MSEYSSATRFCSGVPDSAHLNFPASAKTALAVEQRRSLMEWASSSTMRRHEICVYPCTHVYPCARGRVGDCMGGVGYACGMAQAG